MFGLKLNPVVLWRKSDRWAKKVVLAVAMVRLFMPLDMCLQRVYNRMKDYQNPRNAVDKWGNRYVTSEDRAQMSRYMIGRDGHSVWNEL